MKFNYLFAGMMSLMMAATVASCSDNESSPAGPSALSINVGLNNVSSRAIVEGETLPSGSQIGLTLQDASGSTYDGKTFNNIVYTATGTGDAQTWAGDDIMLSATEGTLYSYFPYSSAVTDITAIPMDITTEHDYMYGEPVTGLNTHNSEATITLKHAQSNIRLALSKSNYSGAGVVSAVSVQSDGAASTATLNAKTGALSSVAGGGTAIERTASVTLAESVQNFDVMVIPTGTSSAITFIVTIDGQKYIATTAAIKLEQGYSYTYALKMEGAEFTLAQDQPVNVVVWDDSAEAEDLTMTPQKD